MPRDFLTYRSVNATSRELKTGFSRYRMIEYSARGEHIMAAGRSELPKLDRSVAASSFQIVSIPKRSQSVGGLIYPDQRFSDFDMYEPRARAKGSDSLRGIQKKCAIRFAEKSLVRLSLFQRFSLNKGIASRSDQLDLRARQHCRARIACSLAAFSLGEI